MGALIRSVLAPFVRPGVASLPLTRSSRSIDCNREVKKDGSGGTQRQTLSARRARPGDEKPLRRRRVRVLHDRPARWLGLVDLSLYIENAVHQRQYFGCPTGWRAILRGPYLVGLGRAPCRNIGDSRRR